MCWGQVRRVEEQGQAGHLASGVLVRAGLSLQAGGRNKRERAGGYIRRNIWLCQK